jgi:hypothetical protein
LEKGNHEVVDEVTSGSRFHVPPSGRLRFWFKAFSLEKGDHEVVLR